MTFPAAFVTTHRLISPRDRRAMKHARAQPRETVRVRRSDGLCIRRARPDSGRNGVRSTGDGAINLTALRGTT